MPPELHVIGLNLVFFAVAYLAVYPRLEPKTLRRMMVVDMILIAALLGIAGSVYFGLGTRFSLLFFDVNWWVFTLLCAVVVEIPFFLLFCRKWDIDWTDFDG